MATRRIQILPDSLVNQIAAGEVVERPASVVKELVENALDAAATRIEVEIRNGGKTEIRVADDGVGMIREDALLAIDRHATSKIRADADLHAIRTLGFRGEALPSIAAVSRFELETASEEEPVGTRVRLNAGRVVAVDEMARRRGTTVTVRSLFMNVPARAKFLKSAAAEARAVSDVVVTLALGHLGVEFRLVSNGRELLGLRRAPDLATRIGELWGESLVDELVPLDHREGRLRVAGLVQRPDAARPGARRAYLFVHGRPFTDRLVLAAADDAYRTTVPAGHRPTLFLYLELPVSDVDVNVHPTKAEVRFRDRADVEAAVRAAVGGVLGELESAAVVGAVPRPPSPQLVRPAGPQSAPAGSGRPAQPASQMALFVPAGAGPAGEAGAEEGEEAWRPPARAPLWQLHDTYILAQTRAGLVIVDQHSAHERVLFEEIVRGFERRGASAQRLLFPITMRLSPAEYAVVEELGDLFRRVGFELEPFGRGTVVLYGIPNPHPYFDAERCFREMATELAHGSPLVNSARNQHERVAKSFACKAAIKAGRRLSEVEMAELFDRLFATELPGHDVHGRPTLARLSLEELGRRFGRT